jgi:hypothetical protein
MPDNPYVGAASGVAGAAASNFQAALRYVTALREAADQQQKLQQQQELEYKKEVMGLWPDRWHELTLGVLADGSGYFR